MRILRFILLKIAEIGLLLGIPAGIGRMLWIPSYLKGMDFECSIGFWSCWLLGILTILTIAMVLFFSVIIIVGIYALTMKNWEWSK